MSGLLDGVLPWIFSQGDTMKRNLRGNVRSLLEDPRGYAQSIGQDIAAENARKSQAAKALLYPSVMDEQGQQQAMQAMTETALNLLAPTVYHGSPHKFDRFDSSKIGTGEGAQAYGHGLYFADKPEVAREYAKVDPSVMPPPNRMFRGQELIPGSPEYHAGTLLERTSLAKARKEVSKWIEEGSPDPNLIAGWKKTLDTLNQAKSKADFTVTPNSNLYKVDLPDDMAAKMLDWDKPLSQQAEAVRVAAMDLGLPSNATGKDFYNALANHRRDMAIIRGNNAKTTLPEMQSAASDELRGFGIPGIRYLDAGSRALPETELARIAKLEEQARHYDGLIRNPPSYMRGNEDFAGWTKQRDAALSAIEKIKSGAERTHNYVVFPGGESQLKILERNGKGLLDR